MSVLADALAAAQTRAVAAIGKALVAGQIPLQQIKKFQQAAECVSGAEHDVAIRSRDRRAGCAG